MKIRLNLTEYDFAFALNSLEFQTCLFHIAYLRIFSHHVEPR